MIFKKPFVKMFLISFVTCFVIIYLISLVSDTASYILGWMLGALTFFYLCYLLWWALEKVFDLTSSLLLSTKSFTKQSQRGSKSAVTSSQKRVSHEDVQNLSLPKQQTKENSVSTLNLSSKRDSKEQKKSISKQKRSLFQYKVFHPIPLEGNISTNNLKKINDFLANVNPQEDSLPQLYKLINTFEKKDRELAETYVFDTVFHPTMTLLTNRYDKNKKYDVCVWKIVDTNQVFFIDAYLHNHLPSLDCDQTDDFYKEKEYIISHNNISYEIFESNIPGNLIEKELEVLRNIANYSGNLLLNLGFASKCNDYFDPLTHKEIDPYKSYQYMSTPKHCVTLFDYLYKGKAKSDFHWDKVNRQQLKQSAISGGVYAFKLFSLRKNLSKNIQIYDNHLQIMNRLIKEVVKNDLGGNVYKNVGKRSKCVIVLTDITDSQYIEFRKQGLCIYHAFDVLKYLDHWNDLLDEYIKIATSNKEKLKLKKLKI